MYKTLEVGDEIVMELDDIGCQHCNQWVGIDPDMYNYCNQPVIIRKVYNAPVPNCHATQFGIEGNSYIWSECWIIHREGVGMKEPTWEV